MNYTKKKETLRYLVIGYHNLRTTISHTRRPQKDLIEQFNNVIKELSEKCFGSIEETKLEKKFLDKKLSSTFHDQLSENDEFYESLIKRINENIVNIEKKISEKASVSINAMKIFWHYKRKSIRMGLRKFPRNFSRKKSGWKAHFTPENILINMVMLSMSPSCLLILNYPRIFHLIVKIRTFFRAHRCRFLRRNLRVLLESMCHQKRLSLGKSVNAVVIRREGANKYLLI